MSALTEFSRMGADKKKGVLENDSEGLGSDLCLVLREIADDGIVRYPWALLREFISQKLRHILNGYHQKWPDFEEHLPLFCLPFSMGSPHSTASSSVSAGSPGTGNSRSPSVSVGSNTSPVTGGSTPSGSSASVNVTRNCSPSLSNHGVDAQSAGVCSGITISLT
eukprot:Filipodium_phascolosomae@DN8284_c0_g1_i1.p1